MTGAAGSLQHQAAPSPPAPQGGLMRLLSTHANLLPRGFARAVMALESPTLRFLRAPSSRFQFSLCLSERNE